MKLEKKHMMIVVLLLVVILVSWSQLNKSTITIEEALNTTKIPESDKETMKEELQKEEWIPITVRVKSSDVVDGVINTLSSDEFKLGGKYTILSGFFGSITKSGLDKLKNNKNVERINYAYPTVSGI